MFHGKTNEKLLVFTPNSSKLYIIFNHPHMATFGHP